MRTSVPSISYIPTTATTGRFRWSNVAGRLKLMWQVYRERRQLKQLDERMLQDIGLERGDVEREAERSLMDIPAWRL